MKEKIVDAMDNVRAEYPSVKKAIIKWRLQIVLSFDFLLFLGMGWYMVYMGYPKMDLIILSIVGGTWTGFCGVYYSRKPCDKEQTSIYNWIN